MSNRRTSAYFLRLTLPTGDTEALLTALRDAALPEVGIITDQSSASSALNVTVAIGYRAAGDEGAYRLARTVTGAFAVRTGRNDFAWALQTGYGIHRRTVTPEAVTG